MNRSENFKDSMSIFGVITVLMYVLRLWPILLLVIVAAIGSLVYVIYIDAHTKRQQAVAYHAGEYMDSVFESCQTAITGTERALMDRFGRIQQGISEQLQADYPKAIWCWESSNPFDLLEAGLSLRVVLKRAGGIPKAKVLLKNGNFAGLEYYKAVERAEPAPLSGDKATDGDKQQAEVDYTILAMRWVENNYSLLQAKEQDERPYIPTDMLPDIESWDAICKELNGWGYEARIGRKGIAFKLIS